MKRTSRRLIGRVRDGSRDAVKYLASFPSAGKGGQKSLSIGMSRLTENMRRFSLLGDHPGIHHVYTIGDLRNDSEIMGNVEKRHVPAFLQFSKQVENLCLDRYVQSRRRFIGNDQVRIAREGHGDHHALSLTPTELMGIVIQPLLGRWDAYIPEKLDAPLPQFILTNTLMNQNGLSNLVTDREHRIERGHGFLKNHGDPPPADLLHLFFIQVQEILTIEEDFTSHDPAGRHRENPQDGEG